MKVPQTERQTYGWTSLNRHSIFQGATNGGCNKSKGCVFVKVRIRINYTPQ